VGLSHHDRGVQMGRADRPALPIGRWFHLEVFLRVATDATGGLAIWQDGIQVFDLTGVSTTVSPWVSWSVGNIAEQLSPETVTVYVDDAAISPDRLGPRYGRFPRAR